MKRSLISCSAAAVAFAMTLLFLCVGTLRVQNFNRIDGVVWDENNRPVPDVYVELADSMGGDLARSRTRQATMPFFYKDYSLAQILEL